MSEPAPLRVVYLGNDRWSVPPLEALSASRHVIQLVLTREPRPGRRGTSRVPTPVAEAARRLGLALREVDTAVRGSGLDALEAARPDVLVVVAYGELLPKRVLELPTLAPVNLHFSLLPELRGASPVRAALLLGMRETGVTTIVMDQGLDTGDVLRQARVPIRPDDDAGSLGARLAERGGRVLVETLDLLSIGSATRTPQDHRRATYAPKIGAADRVIDWTAPAERLVNVVRALAPDPAATTRFRGRPLKVFRARAEPGGGRAGAILEVGREGFAVGTGDGILRILELAPAGAPRMDAAAFVNGYRPLVGERLS